MRTADFDFCLPAELIAQIPALRRDASRLFILHRKPVRFEHRKFGDLPGYLRPGDVLVLNDSKVIPARLRGVNLNTGGQLELLLLEEVGLNDWWVMLRPAKRAREGTRIALKDPHGTVTHIQASVVEKNQEGHRRLVFEGAPNILSVIDQIGEVPLPPYIERTGTIDWKEDGERYQTVFARPAGSVAAPTAGLHFTQELLDRIRALGIEVSFLTLHVGLGTFAPVKSEDLDGHTMHEERFEISAAAARAINRAKSAGGRIVAVGTTTLRVLETIVSDPGGAVVPGSGRTCIFIYPPYGFKVVDALLTNFHLPRSTLLMLVSAFAAPGSTEGRHTILSAYGQAIQNRYRFYSYGDAMLLI
jgi:S-adenosylmethionine:tRNA ribosyltransferase-isomerase